MKKIIFNTLKFAAFLSIGIALMWLAFRGTDWNSFINSFHNLNYFWIVISLLLAWAAFLIRALRWKLLIDPMGYNVSITNTYHAVTIAYLANFAFPRIGEVTRCGVINKTDKVPFDALIGTVITERLFDLLMLIVCVVTIFFVKMDFFGSFLTDNIFMPMADKINQLFSSLWIFALVISALMIAFVALVFMFKHRIKKIAMVQKIHAITKGVLLGATSVLKMKKKVAFLIYTVSMWVCYWLMTWLPVYSMNATSELSSMDGLFLLVIGGMAVTAPVQGGIGVFHALISFALVTLYGISKESSLAFAFIVHESQSILYIILGGISFLLLFLKKKKQETSV